MKTKISNIIKASVVAICIALVPFQAKAQEVNTGGSFFSADWMFNAPLGNDFSSTATGWGANLEGLHYFTPKLAGGAFVSWTTSNEYIPRQTYTKGTTSVTTDALNSLFQLPFGLATRYSLIDGDIVPYVGLKIGAMYSEQYAYFNTLTLSDNNWGFFVSPEIGITFYPTPNHMFGINVAGYYGYATNKQDDFNINGLNNAGFRLGIIVRL